jgi:hypothetical protein
VGWSAYPSILSVNADMSARQPSARNGLMRRNKQYLFDDFVGTAGQG